MLLGHVVPSFFNCNHCNCNQPNYCLLLTFSYQATKCNAKFIIHSLRIALKAEPFAYFLPLFVRVPIIFCTFASI